MPPKVGQRAQPGNVGNKSTGAGKLEAATEVRPERKGAPDGMVAPLRQTAHAAEEGAEGDSPAQPSVAPKAGPPKAGEKFGDRGGAG